jgi:hypothetical protein
MRARRLTVCVAIAMTVAVTASTLWASPAWGDGREPDEPTTGGGVDEDGNPIVVVTVPGTPDDREDDEDADGDGQPDCWWEVVVADDLAIFVYGSDGARRHSATGRWLMRVCQDIGPVAVDGVPVVPEGGRVIPGDLARSAARSVPIAEPVIGTSPSSGRLVVRVPTWLWVDEGWWEPYSATATVGRVSATVTATPVRAVWSAGDGATVVCDAGVAWQPGLAEDATDCAHTYTAASGDGGYELSVEVEIELAWTSNVGQSGTLDSIARTGTQTVQVGEVQAIGTG